MLHPESIFDPTDPNTSARVAALTLVAPAAPAGKEPRFLRRRRLRHLLPRRLRTLRAAQGNGAPDLVGKADPDNQATKDAVSQGTKLSARFDAHAKSIHSAGTTLDSDDFDCRFLIVQTGFQKSVEDYLINFFKSRRRYFLGGSQRVWQSQYARHADAKCQRRKGDRIAPTL